MKKTRFDRLLNKLQFIAIAFLMIILIGDKLGKIKLNPGIETISAILLFSLFLIIQIYLDVRYKEYTTLPYILIADLVQLVALFSMCFFEFSRIDVKDPNAPWDRSRYISYCRYAFTLALLARSILQNEKYKINKTESD